MIEVLHTTLAFILAIALLIAIHEFGHFIVARKLGIKVEKFSIGFGPALFSWRSHDGEVLYVIAAIPLGGYVKMLGESSDEQGEDVKEGLSEQERARAFDVQPVWKRACIAFAGPGFNFIFAILTYMLVAWLGQSVLPAIVGYVTPASVAEQAGMQQGDRVLAVQNIQIHSWQQMEGLLKNRAGQTARITVKREGQKMVLQMDVPRSEKDPLLLDVANELLGFNPGLIVRVDDVVTSSPADKAGLRSGDVVKKINGSSVSNVYQFIEQVKANAGKTVAILVMREQTLLKLNVVPEADSKQQVRIGVRLASQTVHGTEFYSMGFRDGMIYGFVRTWEMTSQTLQVFGKMVTLAISPDNLGGPIAIAQLAGKTAELGLVYFLSFLALISVNLGVLNLLPIPILDGGLLVYLGLEKLRGRPLSSKIMEISQMAGLSLIIALMVFAFYNDLSR